MNIVIVEDEIKIRNGLSRLLSSYDEHQVIAKAKNGKEGIDAIISLRPDLVFTDIKMPEMDGLQMLEQLKDEGIGCHSVILTGYAEFDYAKRALNCGADDYLLKPITVDAVDKVLSDISKKIIKEATKIDANPSSYIRAIITGALDNTEENLKIAERIFELLPGYSLSFVRGYSPNGRFSYDALEEKFRDYKGLYISEDRKDLFLIIDKSTSRYKSDEDISAMLNRRLPVISELKESIWYISNIPTIEKLKDIALSSDKKLLASQMINKKIIIENEVSEIAENDYKYNPEIEKVIEKILVKGNKKNWDEWSENFINDILGKGYNQSSIRQLYMNLSNYIMQLSVKIWPEKGRQLRELESVEKISKAKVLNELKECLDEQASIIYTNETSRDDIHNYTILRAIAYIRENYANKISQEDVANYLSITPEYLSTLFHREMNKTFSVFVNEFRVSHAKRLLKGSDLKIYEIAEQVGFTDTKYFNRVFKDIEGISPKEFRER